jgi:hypothetical protein
MPPPVVVAWLPLITQFVTVSVPCPLEMPPLPPDENPLLIVRPEMFIDDAGALMLRIFV